VTKTITLLTDYGLDDDFVGVCHAVIAGIAPDARVIDLTHGIRRHDIREGALSLRRALPYAPAGIHVAVVDPDVGAERRAIALRVADEQRILVGPDNGVLWLAAQRFGGAVEVVDIGRSPHRLRDAAATFHGRDLFCPVAAQLACGTPLGEVGEPLEPDEIEPLHMPLDVEHAELSATGLLLGHPLTINGRDALYATTFADVNPGDLILYEDAYQTAAIAVNRGSALEQLGLDRDSEVRISPG
jgi:S-adenosylmethionine hydrolase